METYFKPLLVFSHFVLAAYVLAQVLRTDFELLKNYTRPISQPLLDRIASAKRAALWCLPALYVTGVLLVWYGAAKQPDYLANQKLWVKIVCVLVLTLNGVLVHRLEKRIKKGVILAALPVALSLQISLVGAVSSSSWLFACWLGIARSWNNTMPFDHVLAHYAMFVTASACAAIALNIWFTSRVTEQAGSGSRIRL